MAIVGSEYVTALQKQGEALMRQEEQLEKLVNDILEANLNLERAETEFNTARRALTDALQKHAKLKYGVAPGVRVRCVSGYGSLKGGTEGVVTEVICTDHRKPWVKFRPFRKDGEPGRERTLFSGWEIVGDNPETLVALGDDV